jgi:AAA15 family ATPase/GTPase
MLENIDIQNFRCFEDFKADGFERINLIGGKNNSGKTCLLEAIFFGNAVEQPKFVIADLRNQRNADEDNEFYKNVIFQKKIDLPIIIKTLKDGETHKIETTYPFDKSIINFPPIEWEAGRVNYHRTFFGINKNTSLSNYKIIELYKELNEDKKSKVCELLQSILTIKIDKINIDDSIINISTPTINLPIYYFGDALQNIFNYLVILYSNMGGWKNKILLIDEIENGIHYSAHYDFWKAIFKISKSEELNVQIFATTHSLEMIQQFNIVAKEEGEAAYFEMSREYETGLIFAQKHDTELLEYELEKQTSTIRG